MTILTKLLIVTLVSMSFFSLTSFADSKNGQMFFLKKIESYCGISAGEFAFKHTQDEWESIKGSGRFKSEMMTICPNIKLEAGEITDVYDFVYKYAKDSGEVPSS